MRSYFLHFGSIFLLIAAGLPKIMISAGFEDGVSQWVGREITEIECFRIGPVLVRNKSSTGFLPKDSCGKSRDLPTAECLNRLGMQSLRNNDLASAQDYYERALVLQQGPDHGPTLGQSLNGLGTISLMRGEPQAADQYFREASEKLKRLGPPNLELSKSLRGRGAIALMLGDSSKAKTYLLDAIEIQQRLAPHGLDLADSLHSMGDLYLSRGDPVRALGFYQRAFRIRENMAPNSLDTARSLSALGAIALRKENRAQAQKYQRQALALREKLAPGSLTVANSFVELGICCENGLANAQSWFEKALAIQRRLAPNSLLIARSLTMMASTVEFEGNLDQAENYLQEAIAIHQRLAPDSLLFSYSLLQLGGLATHRGDLDRAAEYLEQALLIIEKEAPESSILATGLTSLGTLAQQRGYLIDAERYYRRALAIRQKLKPGGLAAAINLRQLGHIASGRGDVSAASRYHRRALAIREKNIPGSLEVANSLYDLGSVSLNNGDLAASEKYYRRSLALWNKVVPDSHYVAQGLGGLGMLSQARGNWAEAHGWLQQALLIRKRIAPNSLEVAQNLSALGDASREQGDFATAEAYYRDSLAMTERLAPASADHAQTMASLASMLSGRQPDEAEQLYEKSSKSLETQMARLGGSDENRYSFRAKYESNYKSYIDLLIKRDKPDVAFEVSERLRARILLENLAIAEVDVRKGVDPTLQQRMRSLQASITANYERRMRLLTGKHTEDQLRAVDAEIEELTRQNDEVAGEIRSASPVYASLTQPKTLTAKEVRQQLLDADTVLLEYSLGTERSYVFAISQDSLAAYELPKRAEIEAVARHVYDLLTTHTQVHPGETEVQRIARIQKSEALYPEAANRLSQMILGPVARHLGGKRIVVVGDGVLQYISFNALPSPENQAEFLPLVAGHEIVTSPSASVLQVLRQQGAGRARPQHEIAVLADPVYVATDARVKSANKPSAAPKSSASRGLLLRSAAEVGVINGGNHFPRLFFSRREADAIARQIPSGDVKEAIDFQASRTTARSPDLANYRIIHFATHGLLNSEHPELSGLVLSLVDERGRPQDGFLTLGDIYNLNLPADMIVLSACETGLGKEIQGEGLVGITRGFMYAGASRVVTSLWKVDDAATAELMGKFYRGMLKEGLQPAAALRNAQVEMWKQKRWSSPYFWAGFVMQGQW